jgi:hypothetical protein
MVVALLGDVEVEMGLFMTAELTGSQVDTLSSGSGEHSIGATASVAKDAAL